MTKSLGNRDPDELTKNVKDVVVFGDRCLFKLLGKASSKEEGWMKSTKAMYIPGSGCVVQVTTQQGDHAAEAVTFVPGVCIEETLDGEAEVIGRTLVPIHG